MENSNIIQVEVDVFLMKKMSFIGTMQKIFGVFAIIGGALTCLGIITAILGVPYLIAGIKLFKSGSAFSYASYTHDSKFMKEAIVNLASYWLYTLIMIIITVVFYIIALLMMFTIFARGQYY
ncbi:hypothetical protein DES39_0167 [Orbus hercynius]|uniref:DUF5362 domain-containing protein n=1 Tax=Orbus hercynius TaxID=593135 RepID=A0A495RHR5_9GAMM|nr:DUF5362 family protein [Orbus hercynius]RKS86961.1 hypothetical protein DES39_0167 [Orbus hercynius]